MAAANDMLAVGCYAALDEGSLQCPDDISVIGFNDMPFIDRLRPPLTSVRFPHYQLGTEAAQLLLERISGGEGPVKILYLAPELVVRGSTSERLARARPGPAKKAPARRSARRSRCAPLPRSAAGRRCSNRLLAGTAHTQGSQSLAVYVSMSGPWVAASCRGYAAPLRAAASLAATERSGPAWIRPPGGGPSPCQGSDLVGLW